jgi:tetratricopeptide (TPR) repeat protein
MRTATVLCSLAIALTWSHAASASEWYVDYARGREGARTGRCDQAIQALESAMTQRPGSALDVRTYGLEFIDYFPHYYVGLCQLKMGDPAAAVESFDREEQAGAIQARPDVYDDLQARRGDARIAAQRLDRQQMAQARVEGLLTKTEDLIRSEQIDEALKVLAEAKKAAAELDPEAANRFGLRIGRLLETELRDVPARAGSAERQ